MSDLGWMHQGPAEAPSSEHCLYCMYSVHIPWCSIVPFANMMVHVTQSHNLPYLASRVIEVMTFLIRISMIFANGLNVRKLNSMFETILHNRLSLYKVCYGLESIKTAYSKSYFPDLMTMPHWLN